MAQVSKHHSPRQRFYYLSPFWNYIHTRHSLVSRFFMKFRNISRIDWFLKWLQSYLHFWSFLALSLKSVLRDFPGGPVIKNNHLPSSAGLSPGWGINPADTGAQPRRKEEKGAVVHQLVVITLNDFSCSFHSSTILSVHVRILKDASNNTLSIM